MEPQSQALAGDNSRWTVPKLVALVTLLIVAGLLLSSAPNVFLLIFMGILAGIFLRDLSTFLSRRWPLSYGWSLATVLLVLVLLVVGFGWLLGARIASEADNLIHGLRSAWDDLKQQVSQYDWWQQLASQPRIDYLGQVQGDWVARITGVFASTFGAFSSGLLIVFVAIFTAADPGLYRRGLLHMIPLDSRRRARDLLDELHYNLRWWIIGRLFSMTVIGVGTGLGLWLLGIKFSVTLGILAGVLTFIPNFGPILSSIPAILLGLSDGLLTGFYVVLVYVAVQAVESNLLTPLIEQRNVGLPPVLSVAVQVLLGVLVGVIGLTMAAPLALVGMILVKRLYVEDTLGDSLDEPAAPR